MGSHESKGLSWNKVKFIFEIFGSFDTIAVSIWHGLLLRCQVSLKWRSGRTGLAILSSSLEQFFCPPLGEGSPTRGGPITTSEVVKRSPEPYPAPANAHRSAREMPKSRGDFGKFVPVMGGNSLSRYIFSYKINKEYFNLIFSSGRLLTKVRRRRNNVSRMFFGRSNDGSRTFLRHCLKVQC